MADVMAKQSVDRIAEHQGWFIFLGAGLVFAGVLAIAFPLAGGIAVEIWTAIALMVAGSAQIVHAFAARGWSGFLLGLLVGLLYLAAGIILWLNPIKGVVTLAVFLAAIMVIDGALRSVLAFQVRPARGWLLLLIGGLLGIAAGVMIGRQLPSAAFWALGLVLGVNLICSGLAFVMLANLAGQHGATRA